MPKYMLGGTLITLNSRCQYFRALLLAGSYPVWLFSPISHGSYEWKGRGKSPRANRELIWVIMGTLSLLRYMYMRVLFLHFLTRCRSLSHFIQEILTSPSLNMQLSQITAAALLLAGASASTFNRHNATLEDFNAYALTVAKSRITLNSTCTADKLVVRKSWFVILRTAISLA